ncbi:enoyl-CoA hydratase-related protein [Pseudonocardia pini]|uniref:enoyl-CoA hydratase-related protein n=1 Tax=Pseudonocardia pini TaxID=2758030 RepID=UPI0015F033A1|nr:enoyl-CoA hydratase-related protein [Pseudonocardia pini]
MSEQPVRYEVDAGVAVLTLNRPDRRNAMTVPFMHGIEDGLARADADPAVRAVVVTGAGPAFCVGAELNGPDTLRLAMEADTRGHTPSGYREPAGRITERIAAMRIPVIGAVNGDAVGGGATIVAAMDLRIAADTARFGFVFTRRGVVAEGASTWFLPRLVGLGRATDWLVSGRVFEAAEALESGFVSRLLPAAEVLPAALEYARQFTGTTSPASVAAVRRLLAASWGAATPAESARAESAVYSGLLDSPDAKEGVVSFLERRAPSFTTTGTEEAR